MKEQTQKSVTKVFGWPDASWLRAMKMVNRQLLIDGEGKRARRKLCEVSKIVIATDVHEATARLQAHDFQIAHAFTNELLEIAKLQREICEDTDTSVRKRRDVVMVPSSMPKLKKKLKKKARKEILEKLLEPMPEPEPAKPTRAPLSTLTEKQRARAIQDFLGAEERTVRGITVPRVLLEDILTEVRTPEPVPEPIPEPVIVAKPRVKAKTRKEFSQRSDKLRSASKKFATYVRRIQDARPDEAFTPEEDIIADQMQLEIIQELLPMMLSLDDLDTKGIEIPSGNLKSNGAETQKFFNAIEYATERLGVLEPVAGFPDEKFTAIEDNTARELYMEWLKDAHQAITTRQQAG